MKSFDGPDEDYGYQAFIDSVDALVMGRATYEKALTFGEWPYGSKRVVALSSRGVAIPKEISGSVECMSLPARDVVRRLADRPLFGPVAADIKLRHLETRSYPSGLVQSRYEVIRE